MNIVEQRFKNIDSAKKFWNSCGFEIMDIAFALKDTGLPKQSLTFSLQFAEPDLANIYMNFKLNFNLIKDYLGIPEVYVDRNIEIKPDMAEPKRDFSTLQFAKEEMNIRFDKMMKKLQTEMKNQVDLIVKEESEMVKQGLIKKENYKPYEIKSIYEEKLKEQIEKEKNNKK